MYLQAQKLAVAMVDSVSFIETAQAQLDAIMIAINALSLVDSKNAWIVVPKSSTAVRNCTSSLSYGA
jgi:nuclear pore complex protein Nup160